MKQTLDNNTLWNEAAVSGVLFGAVSVACLAGKEFVTLTGNAFLIQAVAFVLWAAEFIGCIYLMRGRMTRLRNKYAGVTMQQAYRFGRRVAILSGLLLASAQTLFILKMPAEAMDSMLSEVAHRPRKPGRCWSAFPFSPSFSSGCTASFTGACCRP